jgi:ATP-dependent helicase HrpB
MPTTQWRALPIDAILPAAMEALRERASLVIEAPPGAGKTTRVPRAMLEIVRGEVIVLEPRRIAARMAARRVAEELGEAVGETVGYQVRMEEVAGPRTRLRFVTEGILTRRMLGDPMLRGVDAVVLDEFHERHLDGDVALALLKRLQRQRPELRVVVMSATLDAAPVARFLEDCAVVRSEGRMFPLTVRHLPYSAEPLAVQVRGAVELLGREGHVGNTLVFLPGLAEIRRAERECAGVAQRLGLTVLPLHGDLTPAEQDRAVMPSGEKKLILATNVAESSVTVEGVTAVIDSGLARLPSYSHWSGLPTLRVGRVSRASATQRAGRAGRVAAGQVVRLYPEEDFLLRPEHDEPEIVRAELSQLVLGLRAMGTEARELEWLTAPPEQAVAHAELLLDRLGARGAMAAKLARFPLPPRLARVVVEGIERGVGEQACVAAAMLSVGASGRKLDLLEAMDAPQDERVRQTVRQLLRVARVPKQGAHDDDALLLALLAGFPDRVARVRADRRVMLSTGMSAELMGEAPGYEFLLALEAEDRDDKALQIVRLTARVEPEWLLEVFPERVAEAVETVWNRTAERVESVRSLLYDKLVLEETRGLASEKDATAMLAQKAAEAGVERFVDLEALRGFLARVEFAGMGAPSAEEALALACVGLRSFAELREAGVGLIARMEAEMGAHRLNELAPATLKLPGGRVTKVHYEAGKPPWIASRLQDFFGMRETPRLGPSRTPVVVHLLAPNQRAVQMTSDLAGFWERLYPQVRRELMRRYPRHQWPEKP